MNEYRSPEKTLNMTLEVLSCAPRVFEIQNFLSEVEIQHLISVAKRTSLSKSSTAGGSDNSRDSKSSTRTSYNSWLERSRDAIIDAVYRRGADLLRIDESLLRDRKKFEITDLDHTESIAEHLQLVHYDPGQEYTAHHDFGYPDVNDASQPARFSTLLLYLNENVVGGETEFPRWYNGETKGGLRAKPVSGKAVLFYSQLPDGNMDDLSHHAALPVRDGEKWLINLWVWDPQRR